MFKTNTSPKRKIMCFKILSIPQSDNVSYSLQAYEGAETAPPVSRWEASRCAKEGSQTSCVQQSQLDKTDESQSIHLSKKGNTSKQPLITSRESRLF